MAEQLLSAGNHSSFGVGFDPHMDSSTAYPHIALQSAAVAAAAANRGNNAIGANPAMLAQMLDLT